MAAYECDSCPATADDYHTAVEHEAHEPGHWMMHNDEETPSE